MLKRLTCLLACVALLSGCGGPQATEREVPMPSVGATGEVVPSVETLPPEITRPEASPAVPVASQESGLLTIRDQIPIYDANTQLDFPITAGTGEDSHMDTGYFHIGSYGHLIDSSGLFRICTDPPERNQGSHYAVYRMHDGGLKELPRFTFSKNYEIQGTLFDVEFEYSQYADQIIVTYISPKVEDYRIHDTALGDNKFLLSLQINLKDVVSMYYPVILDVKTGELTDFLSSIDRTELVGTIMAELDLSSSYVMYDAVLFEGNRLLARMSDENYYFFDPPSGRVYDLNNMSGRQIAGCALAGEKIICWDGVSCYWQVDVNTLMVTDILSDVPYVEFTSGIWQGSGCSFTLYRDEEWNLHAYDFLTGVDKILEEPAGWSVEGYRCHPSPDGRKLYMTQSDEAGTIQFLVFDCDRMEFLLLRRENPNAVQESLTQWTSDNALVVISDTNQDFYVYQWREKENEVTKEVPQFERQDGDFVAVQDYIPGLLVDLKYAQPENFTGHTIYDFQDAYLRYGTVKKLAAVHQELQTMGLGLKIWDGFRPTAAQFKLWEIYPNSTYVANPNQGFSNHSRGNAVDLTLVDSWGRELNMPTEFDDFSGKADRDYSDCSPESAKNAMLLQDIMEKHGFTGYFGEWWHYADSVRYEVEHCFDPSMISQWYAECNEYISLRTAADTASEVITRIPAGGEFTRLGQSGDFFLVEYQGQRGYVLSTFAKPM